MLGLGMNMTKGGFVGKPSITSLGTHLIDFYVSTTADEGDENTLPSSVSLGDIRISATSDSFVGPASNYTVTSLRVRNTTRFPDLPSNWTELITTPLQMDSTVDLVGAGLAFIFFDNDSPMDDIDMGSESGHPQAHNGTGANSYVFELVFEHSGFEGSRTLAQTEDLADSDA